MLFHDLSYDDKRIEVTVVWVEVALTQNDLPWIHLVGQIVDTKVAHDHGAW
ncbi:MAG: hypothetical protein JW797_06215 [Bradymonadales bacterium]|nr:hypothetical protein [Bradymonadales bacterium]